MGSLQQDFRHRYVLERLADLLLLLNPLWPETEDAPAYLKKWATGEYFRYVDDFVKGRGPRSIFFTLQKPKEPSQVPNLVCSDTAVDNVGDKNPVLYFLRATDPGISISIRESELSCEILSGCLDSSLLKYMESVMTHAFQPCFVEYPSWGRATTEQKEEFLHYLGKTLDSLTDFTSNQAPGNIVLPTPESKYCAILEEKNPLQLSVNFARLLKDEHGLNALADMMEQSFPLCKAVMMENPDMHDPTKIPEEVGPLSELEYWKGRLARLDSVQQQLDGPLYRGAAHVLNSTRPQVAKKWKQTVEALNNSLNEAKDNLKYLSTLEKYMNILVHGNPAQIMESLPGLFNGIKMVFIIAKHYSSPERMATLFMKISNQLIVGCKAAVRGHHARIWEQSDEESLDKLLTNLDLCLQLNTVYQDQYHKSKTHLSTQFPGQEFDLNELWIFGKFELFCKRMQKLIDVFTTIRQFTVLQKYNIDGLEILMKRFWEIVDELKRKSSDLLDYTKPNFDKEYILFNKNIQELESSLQVFIISSFENITSTEYALSLLKKFQTILHQRENLKAELESKYMVIFHNYGLDLENVQKTYERHKASPPLPRNAPPIGGTITWVRQLLRSIEDPMKQFQQNTQIMANQKEAKKIIRTYNKVARALIEYETLWVNAWIKSIPNIKDGLKATLIVRQDNKLFVNFDNEIMKLIKEAKWIQRIGGIQIPESALTLLMQEQKYKEYNGTLAHLLKEYDRVLDKMLPITQSLMQRCVDGLDALLVPGETHLAWTSMNIENFLEQVGTGISRFEELVLKILDIAENRIAYNLDSIKTLPLVELSESDSLSLEQFVSLQERVIKKQASVIGIRNEQVKNAVRDIVNAILSHHSSEQDQPQSLQEKQDIMSIKVHYSRAVFRAILAATILSLNQIKKRIGSRNKTGFMCFDRPFFDVSVELHAPNVMINPSLDEVRATIDRCATSVLQCTQSITAWEGLPTTEATYYEEITKNPEIVKVILMLTGGIHGLNRQVMEFLESFDIYKYLWEVDKQELYDCFLASNPTLDDFGNELKKYGDLENDVENIPLSHAIGALNIETGALKQGLLKEISLWKQQYARNLHVQASRQMENLFTEIEELYRKLTTEVTNNLEDLRVVMDTLKEIRQRESSIDLLFRPVEEMYDLLVRYNIPITVEEYDRVLDLRYKWKKLRAAANERNDEIADHLQHRFKSDLIHSVNRFGADVVAFRKDYEANGPMIEGIRPQEAMERLKKYQRLYDDKERKWDTFLAGEQLFALPEHRYTELTKTKKELALLEKLYSQYITVIQKINGYADLLWSELDFQAITLEVQVFQGQVKRMPKPLRSWDAYMELRKTVDDFLELQPLLEKLSHNSMRERHWKDIMKITSHTWRLDADVFKMGDLLKANLLDHKEDIEDIAMASVKEVEIEIKKNNIANDWEDTELSFAEFKHRGPIILKGDDTAQIKERLEESQMALGSMLASRYVGPFREEVSGWMIKLSSVHETLALWMEVQSTWMYLEAVFAGGDIMKQLPQEAKRFSQIDKQWCKIMGKAFEVKNVVGFSWNNEMLNVLPFLRDQLEACQRQLSAYLEQKRNAFPRFYFVSDGVLLEILSQSSDPQAIQPHLVSIFDGLAQVTFEKGRGAEKSITRITAMTSPESEYVALSECVYAQGNVEDWLEKLEQEMTRTMQSIIRDSAHDLQILHVNVKHLKSFIAKYPAQVSLLGLQMIWTLDVQSAISVSKSEQKKAMIDCSKRISAFKNELTDQTRMDLSALQRTKIETLIAIQVHQQEVWEQSVKRVRDVTAFEWQKQSRFYWRNEKDSVFVCIADTDTEYCYEYLGCKERLVVTPLTDRCYITLSQALAMYLGGAPAGPAGTGKTETVKDLGRAYGKYVVVFNCSDQMDFRAMAKTFKGLAQSGAWGCFDEFNRIELPVLSVVAQQVATVFYALKQHKNEFEFTDGHRCRLRTTTGFFITMNPGYAGRQELPENLKILFRGVSMMVPDRKAIMKVKLAAAGYKNDELLAKKFDLLYNLCEQQLSKQRHYDFGLRNILSVLRTAGSVLRASTSSDEEFLLMRTLRDMNLSKLVYDDVELFLSLISDMFAGRSPGKAAYPELEAAIERHLVTHGLVNHHTWVIKVIQLYETKLVRHGIMLVGDAGSGKTSIYNTMLSALSVIERPHKDYQMNPKAITAPQMFGRLDHVSNDWHDGIFSFLWRRANKEKTRNVWIICDGPVDAIWIENLNTVLDDNKLLTLANGDRIQMSASVKMCFEVETLCNASPATVSRAGIIYVSKNELGWEPVIRALLHSNSSLDDLGPRSPYIMPEAIATQFHSLFIAHVSNLYEAVKRACRFIMNTSLAHLVTTAYHLLNPLVEVATKTHCGSVPSAVVDKLFWFSIAWALGGILESMDRRRLDDHIRKVTDCIPPEDTIFEYKVEMKTGHWAHWNADIPSWKYPGDEKLDFSTLFIPTLDSVRIQYLIECYWRKEHPVLLMGIGGTAKTVTMESYLSSFDKSQYADADTYKWGKNNFSSATTCGIFQAALEDATEKRMGSTYGPKRNTKLTLFIDDLNMPDINDWGDQTTNEIVRQVIEKHGLYSLDKVGEWKRLVDLQYVGAMSHPGGGRNDIPNRLKRHFAVINMPLPSDVALQQIYGAIFRGRFCPNIYPASVCEVGDALTVMSISLWHTIQAKMLPTPAKFHYSFNLRDLTRLTQGVMMTPRPVIEDDVMLVSLWKHECARVFSDKLNTIQDKIWYDKAVEGVIEEYLGDVMAQKTAVNEYFVNFLKEPIIDPETGDELETAPVYYEPIESVESLRQRINQFMLQFNEAHRYMTLDLVLFDAAVKHIVRISRILALPRGSALLVGVGGSGKQSLTRLSSFIAKYEVFQIVPTKSYGITNFFDDLRKRYQVTGLGKATTFLFTDNEIKHESFLEYINNVLSSGEVPGLFSNEDKDSVRSEVRIIAKKERQREFQDTEDYLWKFFIQKVRDNLHFVLCFSPVGDKFRSRARKFPGIISGCTINWFFPWPQDALIDVARKFLGDFKMETDRHTKVALMDLMARIHNLMRELSKDYFQRFRRNVYCTPRSYLSFIANYMKVYKDKYNYISSLANKVNGGLKNLYQAGEDVRLMKLNLNEKEIRLAEASKETDLLLMEITESTAMAEKKKQEVSAVKDVLQDEAKRVEAGKKEAEDDLAAAQPALDQARLALDAITPQDMKTIKAMNKPPETIRRIFDGVCILLQLSMMPITPERAKNGNIVMADSWKLSSMSLVARMDFIKLLMDFTVQSKDDITDETCELLMPYLRMDDFNPVRARQASGNIAGLCTWVGSMYTYHNIAKFVGPKIEALREAEGKLRVANAKLQAKEEELAVVEADLRDCQARLDAAKRRKKDLEEDADRTKKRMTAANGLIDALSGERERWNTQSNEFKDLIRLLVGDVAIACAFISYCGPFNAEFRHMIHNTLLKECTNRKIPMTQFLSVTKFLIDEQQITDWNIEGLPTDDHSVQNAIMITRSEKYPLLVDPQGQGLSWLRSRLEPHKAVCTQLTERDFPDRLRETLADGLPLIIENCWEDIDPMLNPVLEQSVVRTGRSLTITINEKQHDYQENFHLFLCTKIPNPHYAPEMYAKALVVDFTVTMVGLEQQLLGRVIQKEKAELEDEKLKLVEEVNANEKRLKFYEDRLLHQLSSSGTNLLDDEELIVTLSDAKKASIDITEKLSVAMDTRKRINAAREEYRPVAIRGSVLYFLIVEMSLVNPMYQTSLHQFVHLFDTGIEAAEKNAVTSKRIQSIINYNTFSLFSYISRGLFEGHKLLFVLLLACKIEMRSGTLTNAAFQCLLKVGAALNISDIRSKPFPWILDRAWLNIVALSENVKFFAKLPDYMISNEAPWKLWWDQECPESSPVPDLEDRISPFDRLLLVRCLRDDRTMLASINYVKSILGNRYAEPQTLDLNSVVAETNPLMPIIFLLSQGSDPTGMIEGFAKRYKKRMNAISMGQGQEEAALAMVHNGLANGDWVLLQNCHLGLQFLFVLEEVLIKNGAEANEEYRMWITSEPNPGFSIGLLQMSVKLTNQPPQGIQAGLQRTYTWLTQDVCDSFQRSEWRPLLYTISFMHTVVQERRKFGALGWCVPYEFNQGDWLSSIQFLQNHLTIVGDDSKRCPVSWDTIRYMVAEIQYGGRITDDKDRVLFNTMAEVWLTPKIVSPDFEFSPQYGIPQAEDINQVRKYIETKLPHVDTPEVFGLHPNADITYRAQQSHVILNTILDVQPRQSASSSGLTREDAVVKIGDDLLKRLPADWVSEDIGDCLERIGRQLPLNIFLAQEIDRLQRVLTLIRTTLTELKLAIAGTIIMSPQLQEALDSLYDSRVPPEWLKISWPGLNLGSWFADVLKRYDQLNNWLRDDRPFCYWLAGFFNAQGFLTSVRQEVTRAHAKENWCLDNVETKTDILHRETAQIDRPPTEGVYIYGLYLEGCSWDKARHKIKESSSKEMHKELPVLHVSAVEAGTQKQARGKASCRFRCPCYKYPVRKDINWIFDVDLPCEEDPSHWILRGVALLCSIDA